MVSAANAADERARESRPSFHAGETEVVPARITPSKEDASPLGLPETSGETVLVALARDPYWLYAYWDVTPEEFSAAQQRAGSSARVLRVYKLTQSEMSPSTIQSWWDVALTAEARDWYLEVNAPATWWCLELGFVAPSQEFVRLARSNVVETPADCPEGEVAGAAHLGTSSGSWYGWATRDTRQRP